jgi:hypothetical protein
MDITQTLTTVTFAEEAKKVMSKPKIKQILDKYKVRVTRNMHEIQIYVSTEELCPFFLVTFFTNVFIFHLE